jgi:hypothetical protein
VIDPKAEARAEAMGCLSRDIDHPRDSNPYLKLKHAAWSDPLVDALIAAWYCGWDDADAAFRSAPPHDESQPSFGSGGSPTWSSAGGGRQPTP